MLGIALSTSTQFVGGEGVFVFSESSDRLAAIARNAKALTVSKIGGRRQTDCKLRASLSRQGGSMAIGLVQHSLRVSRPPVRRAGKIDMSESNIGTKETGGASRGFTLIELMIAVAVVAILAMIAIPTYTAQMIKGRRSSAEAALLDIAQRQQQYMLDARSYAYSVTALNTTTPANVKAYYTVQIDPPPVPPPVPPAFTARATPIAGTAQANDAVLTIDNTGAKTPANLW
jgi:type IV pilus assembly protein PilE